MRYVKNQALLADDLTNYRGGEQLYNILKTGRFQSVKDYDSGEVNKKSIDEAANDIPLMREDDILHVDVTTPARTIVHPEETDDEAVEPDRQLATGRKSTVTAQDEAHREQDN